MRYLIIFWAISIQSNPIQIKLIWIDYDIKRKHLWAILTTKSDNGLFLKCYSVKGGMYEILSSLINVFKLLNIYTLIAKIENKII